MGTTPSTAIRWTPGFRQWLTPLASHALLLAVIWRAEGTGWTVVLLGAVLANLAFDLYQRARRHGRMVEFLVPAEEPVASIGGRVQAPVAHRVLWCVAGWVRLELQMGTTRRRIDVFADEVPGPGYAALCRWALRDKRRLTQRRAAARPEDR